MDIEKLINNYTGRNIKIGIIRNDNNNCIYKIKKQLMHYDINNNIINSFKINTCSQYTKIINKISSDVELYEIYMNKDGFIKAFSLLLNLNVDIVDIPEDILINKNNVQLINLLKEAEMRNIFIITTKKNFNSELKFLCVDVTNDDNVDDILWNDIFYIFSKKFISNILKDINLDDIEKNITNYAASILSAIMALISEIIPLGNKKDREDFLRSLINNTVNKKENINEIFKKKSVIIPAFNEYIILENYRDLINKSVIGYYNPELDDIINFDNKSINEDEYENIIVVNSEKYNANFNIPKKLCTNKTIYAIGNYEESSIPNYVKYEDFNIKLDNINYKLNYINVPIVGIIGDWWSTGKLDTQLLLTRQFKLHNYKVLSICSNPIGLLFNIFPINLWNKLIFPDIVYFINSWLYNLIKEYNVDIITINMGGGILPLSNIINNNFGANILSFIYSTVFDTYIYCTNVNSNILYIKKSVEFINNISNIKPCAVFLNNKKINYYSIYSSISIPVENNEYNDFFNCLEDNFDYPIITKSDVDNEKLYNILINKLGN